MLSVDRISVSKCDVSEYCPAELCVKFHLASAAFSLPLAHTQTSHINFTAYIVACKIARAVVVIIYFICAQWPFRPLYMYLFNICL